MLFFIVCIQHSCPSICVALQCQPWPWRRGGWCLYRWSWKAAMNLKRPSGSNHSVNRPRVGGLNIQKPRVRLRPKYYRNKSNGRDFEVPPNHQVSFQHLILSRAHRTTDYLPIIAFWRMIVLASRCGYSQHDLKEIVWSLQSLDTHTQSNNVYPICIQYILISHTLPSLAGPHYIKQLASFQASD